MTIRNRLFAILLAVAMVVTYMPAVAFAGEEDDSSIEWDAYATESEDYWADVYMENGSAELYVTTEYEGTADYSYEWLVVTGESDDGDDTYETIEGADSAKYKAGKPGRYVCEVTITVEDGRTETNRVTFDVYSWKIISYVEDVAFKYGESVTLKVETDYEGEEITYQWYKDYGDDDSEPEIITGATSASYTPEINHEGEFACRVTADGQTQTAYYRTHIDTADYSHYVQYPEATATIHLHDGRPLTCEYSLSTQDTELNFPEQGDYVEVSYTEGDKTKTVKYTCDSNGFLVSESEEELDCGVYYADPNTEKVDINFYTEEEVDHETKSYSKKYDINTTIDAAVTTPVESISFEPATITLNAKDIKVEEGDESYYYLSERFEYNYEGDLNKSCFAEGDKLTVSYNGSEDSIVYVFDPDEGGRFKTTSEEEGIPYLVDLYVENERLELGENNVKLLFMGKTTTIKVVVEESSEDECKHEWGEGEVTKEPTCGAKGEKTFTCTACGQTKTEEIAATGAHTWNDGEVTTSPTCENKGVKTLTCTVCEEQKTEEIPALGHEWGEWESTGDEQHRRVCTRDGSHKEEAQHSWGDGVINDPASETEARVKTYTCTVCNATKSEPVESKLDEAKTNAKDELDSVDLAKYSEPEKTKVKNAIDEAKTAIENAESIEDVNAAKEAANNIIKAQKTDAQKQAEARKAAQPKEIVDLPVVKISKPKAGKKKATVKWKKVSKKNQKKIQGIEIQVAADPGFKQIVKSTTASKKKKSKTVKGLQRKTTYWVRIRAYKNAADGKHVSVWKVKKVKVK